MKTLRLSTMRVEARLKNWFAKAANSKSFLILFRQTTTVKNIWIPFQETICLLQWVVEQ